MYYGNPFNGQHYPKMGNYRKKSNKSTIFAELVKHQDTSENFSY